MGELQRQEDNCTGSTCTIDSRLSEFSSEPYTHAEFSSRGCVLEEYTTANSTQALEEAEVYDILNAGPRHRFTCEGKLVSNCYGLGALGLYDLMAITYATAGLDLPDWVTLEWCEEFINIWFSIYPEAKIYFDLMEYRARRYKISWGTFGGVRRIPEVYSCHDRVQAAGLRQAGNNPIQRDAAGVFKIGMARVEDMVMQPMRKAGVYAEALLPVHDELIMEGDEEFADVIGESAGYQMEQALVDTETGELHSRVPILTDGHTMDYDDRGYSRWEK
jgi:hypothetical protein